MDIRDRGKRLDLADVQSLDGLTVMRRVASGEFSYAPIAGFMNIRLVRADPGEIELYGEPQEQHCNMLNTIHGGWTATILDAAAACALMTEVPAGFVTSTIEIKVNYVRPMMPEIGKVKAIGKTLSCGKTIGTAEAHLYNEAGKLLAHATETCIILPTKP